MSSDQPAREPGKIAAQLASRTVAPEKPSAPWYDPQPLLASLRQQTREQLPNAAGLERLNDLPLYDLRIDLDARQGTFMLKEAIWFTNTSGETLSEIVLRVYANAVGSPQTARDVPVRFLAGKCSAGVKCTIAADGQSAIRVVLSEPLSPGGRARIEMDLMGRLKKIDSSRTNILAQGIEGMAQMMSHNSAGDYGLLAVGDGIVSLANFYAVIARRVNGQWVRSNRSALGDLGSDDMSHVRATIVTDQNMRIVSTGVPLGTARVKPGGRREFQVGAAMVRDFSVLASADFAISSRRVNGVDVRSYYLSPDRTRGERVLDAAVHSLRTFEKRFGQYPYADLDVVEAPLVGGAGGVEFAGLVTVASMLYRPLTAGGTTLPGGVAMDMLQPMFDSMLEFVTSHEVAHQYWHGLVGSDSRSNPFGDEGLAQMSAIIYMEDRYGKERAETEINRQVAMGYQMMRMLGQPDGPVDLPVAAFETPISYAGLVYGKGPLVYRELRRAVGESTFFHALQEYVDAYSFRVAPRRAFINLLAKKSHRVDAIARRWLEERHGDEDLGAADLGQMMSLLTGQNPTGAPLGLDSLGGLAQPGFQNSPDFQELLKELEQLQKPSDTPATPAELQEIERMLGL